jgi:NAD(P)-dependent dehydrogenase (short-subunit alcohol dehydrogenase family)
VIRADLSRGDECATLVNEAARSLGRLDVLINMASVYSSVPFDRSDERSWDSVIDVDLKAAFLCARAAVPYMRACGGGRIINFADWIAASG